VAASRGDLAVQAIVPRIVARRYGRIVMALSFTCSMPRVRERERVKRDSGPISGGVATAAYLERA
jgi:hypothetical protein